MIKVGLLGLGRMGSKYFKTLKNNKKIKIRYILKNKKTKKKIPELNILYDQNKFFLISKKKVHAYIVASPIQTHFKYI